MDEPVNLLTLHITNHLLTLIKLFKADHPGFEIVVCDWWPSKNTPAKDNKEGKRWEKRGMRRYVTSERGTESKFCKITVTSLGIENHRLNFQFIFAQECMTGLKLTTSMSQAKPSDINSWVEKTNINLSIFFWKAFWLIVFTPKSW